MSTPLYQEALIEARKLREAAAAEAKNAVLEAVSPLIKQMIDKEISGIIVEQEEPIAAAGDLPPPAPPLPSPDAGATGPVDAMPPAGIEPASPTPMPGMTPAVAAASPPIAPVGTPVMGKIDVGPTGEQQIVIPIDSLFAKETTPAETGATAVPPAEATPEMPATPEAAIAAPPPAGPEAAPGAPPAPESLKEIYLAVQRLLREQGGAAPPPAPPPPPPPPTPTTTPEASGAALPPVTPTPNTAAPVGQPQQQPPQQIDPTTGQPMATPAGAAPGTAGPATAAVDQLVAQSQQQPPQQIDPTTGQPMVPPAGAPPPPAGAPPPPAGAPPPPAGAAVPPPAAGPMQEYKVYKTNFELVEQRINSLRNGTVNPSFVKEGFEKKLFGLYQNLIDLKNRNAISPRLFSFNEDRLGLLYENLNVITSYNRNPLTKGKNMANKNSLKDLVHALFEGAEGFEHAVGKVDPAGDSKGGSAEHAHKVSGNPKGVKAEAESAPFRTKEKSEWPGKPSPESLLEQLEEEINELMSEMGSDENEDEYVYPESSDTDGDEAVLEFDSDEVVNEAKKARARLKALREQAEEDKLSLTIDLDGVSGANVSNVNVSLDGEALDVDMEEEDMEESEMGDEEEEVDLHMGDEEMPEEEEEEETLKEARKIVRRAASEASSLHENKVLRGQLAETQLLTARSLFVNKLFVRDDLSGAQKRKIVEYLDSARTLAEAKEVYNRIVRVLNTAKKSGMMNESVEGRRILGEGAGQAVEPSFDTSRWQVLAGVKKSGK